MAATKRALFVFASIACLVAAALASTALAEGAEGTEGSDLSVLTPKLIEEANDAPTVEMTNPGVDTAAARTMPHTDLDRGEALDLVTSVFGEAVETPAGIFDEMPSGRFIGDDTEVVSPESAVTMAEGEGPGKAEEPSGPVLIESGLPLRTQDDAGAEEPVDLGLERNEGELGEKNPIVSVGIPGELGEGIELAEGEIGISFPGAASERVPTTVEGDSAFYPNVQENTDLVVAPMPTGVETLTQIRSPDAPTTEVDKLSLPAGATLTLDEAGGAEVKLSGRQVMEIAPPSAIDAAGDPVQTSLSVSGDHLTITVMPPPGAAFPILVDPTFRLDQYNWTWAAAPSPDGPPLLRRPPTRRVRRRR